MESVLTFLSVTDQLLGEVVRRILAIGSPIKIVMFGSHAKGTARPDSDLDLLISEETNLFPIDVQDGIGERSAVYFPPRTLPFGPPTRGRGMESRA